jgi:hypothetical protein
MVSLHSRYYARKPVTAKTLMPGGDLLACVLGGVYTEVEKTMIEIQQTTIVQETRNAFQNAMRDKFIATAETRSGRPSWRSSPTTTLAPTSRSSSSCSFPPSRTRRADQSKPTLPKIPIARRDGCAAMVK